MNTSFEIIDIQEKILVGKKIKMSLSNDKTLVLWKDFKSGISVIHNRLNSNFYSVQIYDSDLNFVDFKADTIFETWASVEVIDHSKIPDGMEQLIIPKGKYAVFLHKGTAKEAFKTNSYIFGTWLPKSKYQLDDRPHFQVMELHYKPDDPESIEMFWIPVRLDS